MRNGPITIAELFRHAIIRIRRPWMFKRIVIEMSSPICTCPEQNLAWDVGRDKDGNPTLILTCKACGVELRVPNKQFKAGFSLERPYPGKQEEPKTVKHEPHPSGEKVVQLFPDKKQDG